MLRPSRSHLVVPVAAALLLAVLAGPTLAASDPPGNNGTVKVAGKNVDTTPDNEPHPGCIFNVEFFGFDEGLNLKATASFTVLLTSRADGPTFDFPEVWIGQDPASGAGTATGLDATRNYDLNDELAPYVDASNPNQGVHVRLTVHADGAQNADTKSKVFWAQDCVPTPPPPPQES
jgi:hypothetical protein